MLAVSPCTSKTLRHWIMWNRISFIWTSFLLLSSSISISSDSVTISSSWDTGGQMEGWRVNPYCYTTTSCILQTHLNVPPLYSSPGVGFCVASGQLKIQTLFLCFFQLMNELGNSELITNDGWHPTWEKTWIKPVISLHSNACERGQDLICQWCLLECWPPGKG